MQTGQESITLYSNKFGSDKEYNVELAQSQNVGWVVRFEYGRRGGSLNVGMKTPSPVPYVDAKKIYDKLVAAKIKKGYSPAFQTPAAPTPSAQPVAPMPIAAAAPAARMTPPPPARPMWSIRGA